MRKTLLIFILFLVSLSVEAQNKRWFPIFRAGVAAGAPIPPEIDTDSSSGQMKIGPYAFGGVQKYLSWHWRVEGGLQYMFKGARYSQTIRRDTLIEIELIPGVKDTVPSFYTATASGNMSFHYLEMPFLLHYCFNNTIYAAVGVTPSLRIAGKDTGTVHVVIGEGGFFDDEYEKFDNRAQVRPFGLVATLGGGICTPDGFSLELRLHRSLTGLYKKSLFEARGLNPNNPFHTHLSLGIGWRF